MLKLGVIPQSVSHRVRKLEKGKDRPISLQKNAKIMPNNE